MKKVIVIVVVVAVVVYVFGILVPNIQEKKIAEGPKSDGLAPISADRQDGKGDKDGPGGPGGGPGFGGPNPMEQIKDESGNLDIAKLDEADIPDRFKESLKEQLTRADADGNGLVDETEQKELDRIRGEVMRERTFEGLKNDEGKIDLSKLDEARMPDPFKEAIRGADADADGFLNDEELEAAKKALAELPPPGRGGRGPGGPGGPGMGGGGPGGAPRPEEGPAPAAE